MSASGPPARTAARCRWAPVPSASNRCADAVTRSASQLRFRDDLTPSEIGDWLRLSRMHISRLLTRAVTTLRAGMLART